MNLESVIVLLSHGDAACFEGAPATRAEAQQCADEVFVLDSPHLPTAGPRMSTGSGGRTRTLRDEDRSIRNESVDVTEKMTNQIDAVRSQVAQDAGAAALTLVSPTQSTFRVGRIVAEETKTRVRDRAQLP